MNAERRIEVVSELRTEMYRLQGINLLNSSQLDAGLGLIRNAFPNASFPLGAIHEFLSPRVEDIASTNGFIAGLLSSIMGNSGAALWISSSRRLFPPALKNFGLSPDRFIFIDARKEKDVLWAVDEALKCGALTAVIGEIKDMSFTASRRLQLAVEQSQVTGFILRNHLSHHVNTTACASRWKITSLPSEPIDNLDDFPGIGYPKWKVELLKVKNGKPGSWNIYWMNGKFAAFDESLKVVELIEHKKAV